MPETEMEDRETYAMILAKQASDESTVDEKGNLIRKREPLDTEVKTSGKPKMPVLAKVNRISNI